MIRIEQNKDQYAEERSLSMLIAEDHPIYRKAVISIFREQPFVQRLDFAVNGTECIKAMSSHSYDVVLLDINMPFMDGVECLTIIKSKWPGVKVIILTQYTSYGLMRRIIEKGASGFLGKSITEDQLINDFKSIVYEGKMVVSEDVDKSLRDEENNFSVKIGESEFRILKLMCSGLNSDEIATNMELTSNTIKTHKKNLLQKTGCKNASTLVLWARDSGILEKRYS